MNKLNLSMDFLQLINQSSVILHTKYVIGCGMTKAQCNFVIRLLNFVVFRSRNCSVVNRAFNIRTKRRI